MQGKLPQQRDFARIRTDLILLGKSSQVLPRVRAEIVAHTAGDASTVGQKFLSGCCCDCDCMGRMNQRGRQGQTWPVSQSVSFPMRHLQLHSEMDLPAAWTRDLPSPIEIWLGSVLLPELSFQLELPCVVYYSSTAVCVPYLHVPPRTVRTAHVSASV